MAAVSLLSLLVTFMLVIDAGETKKHYRHLFKKKLFGVKRSGKY